MKKLIILAVLAIGMMTPAMAQKFGHANFQEIVELLPERAAAEKEVQDLQASLEASLADMVAKYQEMTATFTTDTTLTETMRNSLRTEIQDKERRIQDFQQMAYSEIEVKQAELMNAMITKVRDAAVAVGTANSYTYIFDSSPNGSLLYAGGEDVTVMVKTQLGI